MSTAPFTTRAARMNAEAISSAERALLEMVLSGFERPTSLAVDREMRDLLRLAFNERRQQRGDGPVDTETWESDFNSLKFHGVPLRLAGEQEQTRVYWSLRERLERVLVVRLAELAPAMREWEQLVR